MHDPFIARYHGLDFLRALAMLLGLVFHAPMLYYIPEMADGFQEFGISSVQMPVLEPWLHLLIQWLHLWRMPTFFVLCGFFAALMICKHGLTGYLKDRMLRIGLTMLVFAALYDLLDGQYEGKLEHIWFLYYLLIYSFCFLIIGMIKPKYAAIKLRSPRGDFAAIMQIFVLAIALVIGRGVCDYLDGGAMRVATHYANIPVGGLLYFGLWFGVGVWLFRHQFLFDMMSSLLSIAILGVTSVALLFHILPNSFGIFGHNGAIPDQFGAFLSFSLGKGATAMLWVALLVLIAHRLFSQPTRPVLWLARLSYPVYLFHFLPTLLVSAILIGQGYDQAEVVIGTVVAAFAISLILYYTLVKFTPLSWLIFGYKKSWLRLWG